jgi:sporulation protein YlmC with PRC-barrel domain
MKRTLADLEGLDVVTEDGERLGPLRELRCRGVAARVDTLVVGTRGWLERIGVAPAHGGEIPARAVVRWERDVVVVRRGTRVQRRP